MMTVRLPMLILLMLLLASSASSMNQGDRAYVSDKVMSTLSTDANISDVSANIEENDVLNIWMVPASGPGGDADSNAIACLEAATGVFLGVHRDYPEVDRMNVTLSLDGGNRSATAYCLGEWVDAVQFNGDIPDSDDLLSLVMRVIGTLNGI